MKTINGNNWTVKENELHKGLFRFYIIIKPNINDNDIWYTLNIIDSERTVLELNFKSLEDAFCFVENINKFYTLEEVNEYYQKEIINVKKKCLSSNQNW